MQSTDRQVRRLMEEFKKHGEVGQAALRADMDRKTARKYLAADKLPSDLKEPRTWRTRADPFDEDWPYVLEMIEDAPDLEASLSSSISSSVSPASIRKVRCAHFSAA